MDPLAKSYPFVTPYAFAENATINSIDMDGLEKYLVVYEPIGNGVSKITITTVLNIETKRYENMELYFNDNSPFDQSRFILRIRNGHRFLGEPIITPKEQEATNENLNIEEYDLHYNHSEKYDDGNGKFSVNVTGPNPKGGKDIDVGIGKDFETKKFNRLVSVGYLMGISFQGGHLLILMVSMYQIY